MKDLKLADLPVRKKELLHNEISAIKEKSIKLGLIANYSTQFLAESLLVSLNEKGFSVEVYESNFDQWELEIENPESSLNTDYFDFVVFHLSTQFLYLLNHEVNYDFLEYVYKKINSYCAKTDVCVIWVSPEACEYSYDTSNGLGRDLRVLERINNKYGSGSKIKFLDLDNLIMLIGLSKWLPGKYAQMGNFCCNPNCFPLFGDYLADEVLSLHVRRCKLVIIDADNTIWKGVVGDLGWENIGLSRYDEGRSYLMLQRYLKVLKQSGTLLAMVSKNDISSIEEVFINRSEMILKIEDFISIKANWEPKSLNISRILDELNLTDTGIVFLDDSKYERVEVAHSFPNLIVPELPDAHELWSETLQDLGVFNYKGLSDEDLNRSQMYNEEKVRKEEKKLHVDHVSFLSSLSLELVVNLVGESNFDRAFELLHKTNQFNLTNNRLSRGEFERQVKDDSYSVFCFSLSDKYGDYGIISVAILFREGDVLKIDNWVMSCRVFERGVENAVLSYLIDKLMLPLDTLVGIYNMSSKNSYVKDLYSKYGFEYINESGDWQVLKGDMRIPDCGYILVRES